MTEPHDQHHPSPTRAHEASHEHGAVDPSIASSSLGLWALKWSTFGLALTALFQALVVVWSGSVALLADTIHNFADAATAIPLGIAFWLSRRRSSRRFTYGLGRAEDLAGLAIVGAIFLSGLAVLYQSITRLIHPRPVQMLWAVALASLVGFIGNEAVAIFRIKIGRKIGSAALVADGYHARADGWTSLAVLVGVAGAWAGFPGADPLAGIVISLAIFWVAWESGRPLLVRALDGVEGQTLQSIVDAARQVSSVDDVTDVRARWIGHRLHAEVNITVPGTMSVEEGHAIAKEVQHQLLHHLPHFGSVVVHVDPTAEGGERHHGTGEHDHDGLPRHSHP